MGKLSLRKKIKKGEITVSLTDKSQKLVVTTPEIYKKAALIHTHDDIEIEWKEVKVQKIMQISLPNYSDLEKLMGNKAEC